MRPVLLDLFCGAGGASVGYDRAGFNVVGVDINPQPNYPFEFVEMDALEALLHVDAEFHAIHASPPCQSYSTMSNRFGSKKPELIAEVRRLLRATELPYVIENVTGARPHMESPVMLHGGQFDMRVWRPRLFETNWTLVAPPRAPAPKNPVAVYGRPSPDRRILWTRTDGSQLRAPTPEEGIEAMGMPWATWEECCEAIPPTYTEFIGRQLMEVLPR